MKLAEIYEILGETRRALDLVYEGPPPSLLTCIQIQIVGFSD